MAARSRSRWISRIRTSVATTLWRSPIVRRTCSRRARASSRFWVFFSASIFDRISLRLTSRAALLDRVFGLLELPLVPNLVRGLLGLLLADLLDAVPVFRLSVQVVLGLHLPVELGQQVAGLNAGARGDEPRDDHGRTALSPRDAAPTRRGT